MFKWEDTLGSADGSMGRVVTHQIFWSDRFLKIKIYFLHFRDTTLKVGHEPAFYKTCPCMSHIVVLFLVDSFPNVYYGLSSG